MESLAADLRLLADPTRLRLLRVLAQEELNAGELARVLGLGQPAVSRQAALLRDAGLVAERRAGRFTFFSLAADRGGGSWSFVREQLVEAEDPAGDLARLEDVRRERRERELVGAERTSGAEYVPGRSWRAWARALSWLVTDPPRTVDLGCGEGHLTLEIARFSRSVTAVDNRPAALARARKLVESGQGAAVRFRRADIARTGLRARSFDLAVLSQTLHHAEDPAAVVAEAWRLLAPGGRLLVLDLLPHTEEWVRGRLGHRHLGFAQVDLEGLLVGAGFADAEVERMNARPGDPFRVLIARGTRPEASR